MWSLFLFFVFKQKTAYEMRISDWSSDVCSSDLALLFGYLLYIAWIALASNEGEAMKAIFIHHGESTGNAGMPCHDLATIEATNRRARLPRACPKPTPQYHVTYTRTRQSARPEKSRVGKECVRTCRFRWSP